MVVIDPPPRRTQKHSIYFFELLFPKIEKTALDSLYFVIYRIYLCITLQIIQPFLLIINCNTLLPVFGELNSITSHSTTSLQYNLALIVECDILGHFFRSH